MQANYPGWHISIDNREVPVFTSNDIYLSTLAPSGNHTVIFNYSNPAVVAGFCVCSITSTSISVCCETHFHMKVSAVE